MPTSPGRAAVVRIHHSGLEKLQGEFEALIEIGGLAPFFIAPPQSKSCLLDR
jgi:hypothetical protein